jgi:peroxiredoxin
MYEVGSLTWAGLALALVGVFSYAILLFVIHDFTYRTWLFDGIVSLGVVLAGAAWLRGGNGGPAVFAGVVGLAWFLVTRRELAIRGSDRLRLRRGDTLPTFSLLTTDNRTVTDRDLVADAPTLLVLYRGWWCPSHKAQLDEIVDTYDQLKAAGLSIYAGSVDGPEQSQPVQDRVGDKITILCGVPEELLEQIGIRDPRGAPWYDRLIFGAKEQAISMPASIVVDETGTVTYAYRSTRVDDRASPDQILANLIRS